MERAHRNAERYHEDHYNPAFYIKERKRAVLLFLLFSDTFGVLVIKPFENKQKEEKEHDCGLSYLEKPVLGICQPCHYPYPEDIGPGYNPHHSGGNKQYFSVYSVFHVSVLYNPADTGNKDNENMFVNSYCIPCCGQLYACTNKFPCLVLSVPQLGTRSTLLRYGAYHCVVQELPTVGIPCTTCR